MYLLSRFDVRREEGPFDDSKHDSHCNHTVKTELPVLDSAYVPWSRDRTIVPRPSSRQRDKIRPTISSNDPNRFNACILSRIDLLLSIILLTLVVTV